MGAEQAVDIGQRQFDGETGAQADPRLHMKPSAHRPHQFSRFQGVSKISLLVADNPPLTHLTNPEPLDGARHEVSAVRVRLSPPNPALTQPLLVRFCSR